MLHAPADNSQRNQAQGLVSGSSYGLRQTGVIVLVRRRRLSVHAGFTASLARMNAFAGIAHTDPFAPYAGKRHRLAPQANGNVNTLQTANRIGPGHADRAAGPLFAPTVTRDSIV